MSEKSSLISLSPDIHQGHYEPASASVHIMTAPSTGFPDGWVLLQGVLMRRGGDYDARLYYDLGEGFSEAHYFAIPTSGRGVIEEVIRLPPSIKRLKFTPMGTAGNVQLSGLTLRPIGFLERLWRMNFRIFWMMHLHSRKKRLATNLTLAQMVLNFQATYQRAGKLRVHTAAPSYQQWIEQFDTLNENDKTRIAQHGTRFTTSPYFHILIVADSATDRSVQQTVDSLTQQLYSQFNAVLLMSSTSVVTQNLTQIEPSQQAHWLAEFNVTLADSKANDWLLIVRAGDVFAPQALYRFACAALANSTAAMLYADDDALNAQGERCQPRFKPDWSLTHFRATNFVGDAVAIRGAELANAGGLRADCWQYGNYDLLLRVLDVIGETNSQAVVHIPTVLLHCAKHSSQPSQWGDTQQCLIALREHLQRHAIAGEVSATVANCWRVRYQLPAIPPLVSIIIPTRDALVLLRQCVDSLLHRSSYPHIEILIIDNQSADADALAYLQQFAEHEKVRVLPYDFPFNYSAMNNMAVQAARGDIVCLLNNDTEVISPDWLEEMVGQLLQTNVGIVGAKLYFPNNQIQHAGDLVGIAGIANHAHSFLDRNAVGYCQRAIVAQELSAVTAACLITWKSIYQQLGGLDAEHLTVAFNDVDYCLRVRQAGYRIVWTPHAELYHHESVSRGKDTSPEKKRRAQHEVKTMRKRWCSALHGDAFYNANLSHERPDFSLSNAPILEKPWQD